MDPYTPENENPEAGDNEYVSGPNDLEPVVIAPFHFTLLWIATLGIYAIWWQYKCWKYFQEKEKLDIWPGVRAVLFLVFGIELFQRIGNYCLRYESEISYSPVAVWASIIGVNIIARFPSPFFWLSLLGFIPFLFPVREFNFYFTGNKNGYVDDKLNDKQVLLLVMGVIFWVLIIVSLYMGGLNAADN